MQGIGCSAKKNESLSVQKDTVLSSLEIIKKIYPDAILIDDPWRFSGQEHSTPGDERQLADDALNYATNKNKGDAIIFPDFDRWGRDLDFIRKCRNVLKDNGKKLFIGPNEQDLFDGDNNMIIDIQGAISKNTAYKQKKKSMRSRIKLAKKGYLASGNRPVGRIWEKELKKWDIDHIVKQKYKTIAEEYLRSKSLPQIAKAYGMDSKWLQHNLYNCMGTTWIQKLDGSKYGLGVHEIPTKVPALLKPEVIQAIRERIDANKTVYHGKILKNIFYQEC